MGEPQPAMRSGTEEVVAVRREVHHEQPTARRDESRRFGDGPSGIVEVVQHLVDHDEVEAGRVERRAVHVALAELPVGGAHPFEVGAGDREHRVAGVEPDGAIGACGEELQHASGAGAHVEHPAERLVADDREDRRFDGVGSGVQRALLVPDRGDLLEVVTCSSGAAGACHLEPRPVAGEHDVVGVDGAECHVDQVAQRLGLDEPEERPGPLTVLGDHAGIDEEPEMA